VLDYYQENVFDIAYWTSKEELYLLKEIFQHRDAWKSRDFWDVLKAGAYSGPLEEFSARQLRVKFNALKSSSKFLDQLVPKLKADAQDWFRSRVGHEEDEVEGVKRSSSSRKRKRLGWTEEEDEILFQGVAQYSQGRYRFFQDHERLENKTEDEIYARYLDFLLDGNFVGKLGKPANHHRSEAKFAARRPKRRWTQEEEEELRRLHAFFAKELNNEAPWVQIWLASTKILSHRLTVDIKDKWRNLDK
jgi:hypothetical protein